MSEQETSDSSRQIPGEGARGPLAIGDGRGECARGQANRLSEIRFGRGGALILIVGGSLLWQRAQAKPPLTDKDVLVLADFTNTTGEAVFDITLRQALAIHLEASPFLKIARRDVEFGFTRFFRVTTQSGFSCTFSRVLAGRILPGLIS